MVHKYFGAGGIDFPMAIDAPRILTGTLPLMNLTVYKYMYIQVLSGCE
jgi:hypothetical protein